MDPALLRERESFKQRALSQPVIENKRKDTSSTSEKRKRPKASSASSKAKSDPLLSYKTSAGSSQYNFSVLTKIVKYMKQRHLDGDTIPLSIEEILDETNQLDLSSRQRHWLITEALVNNPKIQVTHDQKYAYKPTYNIKDRKGLMRLLDKHDQRGLGGILMDDVEESLHNAEKSLRILGDNIIVINRPSDKKKVLFYNDKAMLFSVDEEFQKLWRAVAVDGIDDGKIEDYLEKQGISSMQDMGGKKTGSVQKRKKPASKRPRVFKKHNEHMGDILQDYSDK